MISIAKVAGLPKDPKERAKHPPASDPAAAAAYLAAMTSELAGIARRQDFEALTYLLDMARLEAEATVQRLGS